MYKIFIHIDDEVMQLELPVWRKMVEAIRTALQHYSDKALSTEPNYQFSALEANRVVMLTGVIRKDDLDALRLSVQEILRANSKFQKQVSIRAQDAYGAWIVSPAENKPWLEMVTEAE